MVLRIGTTEADELIPRNAEADRETAHILAEERLIEVVVAGRNRSMDRIKRRGTHQFKGLIECQTALHIIHKTLHVAECSVSFIAMVDIFLNA